MVLGHAAADRRFGGRGGGRGGWWGASVGGGRGGGPISAEGELHVGLAPSSENRQIGGTSLTIKKYTYLGTAFAMS